MMQTQSLRRCATWAALWTLPLATVVPSSLGHETGQRHVHFQKPDLTPRQSSELRFRSASASAEHESAERVERGAPRSATPSARPPVAHERSLSTVEEDRVRTSFAAPRSRSSRRESPGNDQVRRDEQVEQAAHEPVLLDSHVAYDPVVSAQFCDTCDGGCICEPGCGICESACGCPEPACGIFEPGCGICEPGCGICEPGCGICEPGCGICEPGCGILEPGCAIVDPGCVCGDPTCGVPGCGGCVDTGPDYWCFPVCLPRLKDARIWAGVHGFKGPRDILDNGPGDGNFGFQQGFIFSGPVPLISRLAPQLSYQLGYQALQSRLSGTSDGSPGDRPQQFLTTGVFRRVPTGLQFGVVWDMMRDELGMSQDFQQVRYQVSLASPLGREFGFRGSSATKGGSMQNTVFQPVDQYTLFFGWQFRRGGHGRFWAGGTNSSEGILGAEFDVPISDRFSVFSGFNYLITEEEAGREAATEESWNIAVNLVWHLGRRARMGRFNTRRSMFEVADNGSMFIDVKP